METEYDWVYEELKHLCDYEIPRELEAVFNIVMGSIKCGSTIDLLNYLIPWVKEQINIINSINN